MWWWINMIPPAWHCCLTHMGGDPKRWIFRNGSDSAPQDEHLWFWLKFKAKIDGWKTKETLQFSTHIFIYIYNAFQNVHMHVSNAWCFLRHGVRGRCSIALFLAPTWTLFTFVPFDFQTKSHAIYFGNEMGGEKMYRLWLLKLCNLHKFIYLSVSVQLIWEGKSFTSRSKKLNFHLNDAHHPVFEQSIFAEKTILLQTWC